MSSVVADVLSSDGDTVVNQILIDAVADPSAYGAVARVAPGSAIGWAKTAGVWGAPPPLAPEPAQLKAYAAAKADGLVAALRTIAADGVSIKSTSTDSAIGKLNALAAWGAANPSATTIWTADDLSTVTVTGAQIAAVAPLALAYSMAVYGAALPAVLAEIAAGTITTTAQIDACAWPA